MIKLDSYRWDFVKREPKKNTPPLTILWVGDIRYNNVNKVSEVHMGGGTWVELGYTHEIHKPPTVTIWWKFKNLFKKHISRKTNPLSGFF